MGEPAAKTYSEPPEPDVRRFGRYTLCYRVARGGMASVYLAQLRADTGFTKWVALKMIHPRMAADERFVQMFMHEAQILSRLDHPNVCSVFDFGVQDSEHYLAMEYLHGESLASVIRRAKSAAAPVGFAIAARIVSDAARGLHAAHELTTSEGRPAGVVHRDVSPQNIFCLYEGISKVVDFGIARSDERGDVTQTGELKGKFHYMSPEQLKQEDVDRRTDVFALGVVLWELTVGRRLFKRKRDVDTMLAVLSGDVPRPSEKQPDYPEALETIVMQALAQSPADRFQTCNELARALNGFISKSSESADHPEVADYLAGLFADRRRAREELLQKAPALTIVPVVELESFSESVQADAAKPRVVGVERPRSIPPPARRASRIPLSLGIVALLAIAGYFAMREPPLDPVTPPSAAAQAPPNVVSVEAAPEARPEPVVEPAAPEAPVVQAEVQEAAVEPSPSAGEPAAAETQAGTASTASTRPRGTVRVRPPRPAAEPAAGAATQPEARTTRTQGGPQPMTDFERVD